MDIKNMKMINTLLNTSDSEEELRRRLQNLIDEDSLDFIDSFNEIDGVAHRLSMNHVSSVYKSKSLKNNVLLKGSILGGIQSLHKAKRHYDCLFIDALSDLVISDTDNSNDVYLKVFTLVSKLIENDSLTQDSYVMVYSNDKVSNEIKNALNSILGKDNYIATYMCPAKSKFTRKNTDNVIDEIIVYSTFNKKLKASKYKIYSPDFRFPKRPESDAKFAFFGNYNISYIDVPNTEEMKSDLSKYDTKVIYLNNQPITFGGENPTIKNYDWIYDKEKIEQLIAENKVTLSEDFQNNLRLSEIRYQSDYYQAKYKEYNYPLIFNVDSDDIASKITSKFKFKKDYISVEFIEYVLNIFLGASDSILSITSAIDYVAYAVSTTNKNLNDMNVESYKYPFDKSFRTVTTISNDSQADLLFSYQGLKAFKDFMNYLVFDVSEETIEYSIYNEDAIETAKSLIKLASNSYKEIPIEFKSKLSEELNIPLNIEYISSEKETVIIYSSAFIDTEIVKFIQNFINTSVNILGNSVTLYLEDTTLYDESLNFENVDNIFKLSSLFIG